MSPSPAERELGARTRSALGWSVGGAIARVAIQLLVQLALARFLGPAAFGQATAALFVLAVGWLLAEAGFGAALIQKATLDDSDVAFALGWVLLLSCAAAAIAVMLAGTFAGWLGDPSLEGLIVACAALIPVQALSNIPTSLLKRELDARRAQLIYLSTYMVAYLGLGLPLAWFGAGAWSLVCAFGAHSLMVLVASYSVVKHTLRPRLLGDADLRRFGLQVTATTMANWTIENVDRLLVNRIWGSAALGEYAASANLSRAPAGLLVNSLQSVVFAAASRAHDDPARIVRGYLALLGLAVLAIGPLSAWLAINADTVIRILYGERWQGAGPLFAAFCTALPFYAVLALTGPLLWAVNAVSRELVVQAVGVVAVVAGLMVLAGQPLQRAVWLVPLVYAGRAIWVGVALGRRLGISARAAWTAVRGGSAVSAGVVTLAWTLQGAIGPLGAAAASAVLTIVGTWVVVRILPRWLLTNELRQMLSAHADRSRAGAWLCRALGIQAAGEDRSGGR